MCDVDVTGLPWTSFGATPKPGESRSAPPRRGNKRFLVVYNYGMGEVPFYILAHSADEIRREFPEFRIEPDSPPWLTAERRKNLEEKLTYDLELDANREPLASVKRGRPGSANQ